MSRKFAGPHCHALYSIIEDSPIARAPDRVKIASLDYKGLWIGINEKFYAKHPKPAVVVCVFLLTRFIIWKCNANRVVVVVARNTGPGR